MSNKKPFIIDLSSFYGRTDYCIVRATSIAEAQRLAHKKYPCEEKSERRTSFPPCEIVFDEDGISQVIAHVW